MSKKYVIDDSSLMSEWNYDKNDTSPERLTVGSGVKVWWKCKNGHEWQATIKDRHRGAGCPYCSGRFAISGINDLQTMNPKLAKEWNYAKNGDLTPLKVLPNSNKKVWWKCKNGHEWQATINHRNRGTSCPFCSGNNVIQGTNDLQTLYPRIAKEWNFAKKLGISPAEVFPYSNKKVWWVCKKGHEWKSTINNRVKGNGCPICSSGERTSFPEYAILYYLKNLGIEAFQSYKEFGYELDIYIPSLKTAIEYDGSYWHKTKFKADLKKNLNCKKNGILLFRIREESLPNLNDSSIDYFVKDNGSNLSEIIRKVLADILNIEINVDIQRDYTSIENLREQTTKIESILITNPNLVKEWNFKKNAKLLPEHVTANSAKKVWWICEKGHEYQATIANRSKGNGCPYCAGKLVTTGENDLKTLCPSLAEEWNYEKNGDLLPEKVTLHSGKKVWWICKKGHEYQATIDNRSRGKGCPICANKVIIKGYNDLQTINPKLVMEWNYSRNINLFPSEVSPNSHRKVWWICKHGHEWQARIADRNRGKGCPICAKNRK